MVGLISIEEFAALAGALEIGGNGEDFDVVHESVDHRGSHAAVGEASPQRLRDPTDPADQRPHPCGEVAALPGRQHDPDIIRSTHAS